MFKKTVFILFIFILSGCILIVGEPNASIKAVLDKEKNEVVLYFSKPYVSDKESEIKVDSVNYPFEKNNGLTEETNLVVSLDKMNKKWYETRKIEVLNFKTRGFVFANWFTNTVFYVKDMINNFFADMDISYDQNKKVYTVIVSAPFNLDPEGSKLNIEVYYRYPLDFLQAPIQEITLNKSDPLFTETLSISKNSISWQQKSLTYNLNDYLIVVKNLISENGGSVNLYIGNIVNNVPLPDFGVEVFPMVFIPTNIIWKYGFNANPTYDIKYAKVVLTNYNFLFVPGWIAIVVDNSIIDDIIVQDHLNNILITESMNFGNKKVFYYYYPNAIYGIKNISIIATAKGFLAKKIDKFIEYMPYYTTNISNFIEAVGKQNINSLDSNYYGITFTNRITNARDYLMYISGLVANNKKEAVIKNLFRLSRRYTNFTGLIPINVECNINFSEDLSINMFYNEQGFYGFPGQDEFIPVGGEIYDSSIGWLPFTNVFYGFEVRNPSYLIFNTNALAPKSYTLIPSLYPKLWETNIKNLGLPTNYTVSFYSNYFVSNNGKSYFNYIIIKTNTATIYLHEITNIYIASNISSTKMVNMYKSMIYTNGTATIFSNGKFIIKKLILFDFTNAPTLQFISCGDISFVLNTNSDFSNTGIVYFTKE